MKTVLCLIAVIITATVTGCSSGGSWWNDGDNVFEGRRALERDRNLSRNVQMDRI